MGLFSSFRRKIKRGAGMVAHVFKKVGKQITRAPVSLTSGVLSEATWVLKKAANSNPVTGSIRSLLNRQLKFTIGALKWGTNTNNLASALSKTGLASKSDFKSLLGVAELGADIYTLGRYSAGKAALGEADKISKGNFDGAVKGFVSAAAASAFSGGLSSVVGADKAQAITGVFEQVQDSKQRLEQFADSFEGATKEPAFALANYGAKRFSQSAKSALSISSGFSENLADLNQLAVQHQARIEAGQAEEYDKFVKENSEAYDKYVNEEILLVDPAQQKEQSNDALQFVNK